MGRVIRGRFAKKVKGQRVKRKVKPAMSTRPREYLTITHKAIRSFGPCSSMYARVLDVFPFAEFGTRGIPVTVENALRMLEGNLPPRWVLERFCGHDRFNSTAAATYRGPGGRIPTQRQRAAIFVNLLHEYANDEVRRITAPSKLTTLKGAPLMKVAA